MLLERTHSNIAWDLSWAFTSAWCARIFQKWARYIKSIFFIYDHISEQECKMLLFYIYYFILIKKNYRYKYNNIKKDVCWLKPSHEQQCGLRACDHVIANSVEQRWKTCNVGRIDWPDPCSYRGKRGLLKPRPPFDRSQWGLTQRGRKWLTRPGHPTTGPGPGPLLGPYMNRYEGPPARKKPAGEDFLQENYFG
jgi:hypothetical protein